MLLAQLNNASSNVLTPVALYSARVRLGCLLMRPSTGSGRKLPAGNMEHLVHRCVLGSAWYFFLQISASNNGSNRVGGRYNSTPGVLAWADR
jgi:hypothetical protein